MIRHLLVREIGVWLAIKLAALTAIFFLFFGPEQRLEVLVEQVEAFSASGAEASPVRVSLEP
jgi:hypothetical protein